MFASMAKRFHDVGKSGSYCLVVFIPLLGAIAASSFVCSRHA
jgi:uncharacterized membrane protein YhaH (DUF805 family)